MDGELQLPQIWLGQAGQRSGRSSITSAACPRRRTTRLAELASSRAVKEPGLVERRYSAWRTGSNGAGQVAQAAELVRELDIALCLGRLTVRCSLRDCSLRHGSGG
jgi:hypothetical protein